MQGFQPVCFRHQLGKLDAKLMMTFLVSFPPFSLSSFFDGFLTCRYSVSELCPHSRTIPVCLLLSRTIYLFQWRLQQRELPKLGSGKVSRNFCKRESAHFSHSPDFISATSFSHDNNMHSFIDTSVAIETIATSAYLETLPAQWLLGLYSYITINRHT